MFNGIQRRAENTKYISAVDAAIKAVKMYETTTGSLLHLWPDIGEYDIKATCLQKTADLPALAPFGEGECWLNDNGSAITADDAVIDRLYSGSGVGYLPTPLLPVDYIDGVVKARAAVLGVITQADGSLDTAFVQWIPPDGGRCSQGESIIPSIEELEELAANNQGIPGTGFGPDVVRRLIETQRTTPINACRYVWTD